MAWRGLIPHSESSHSPHLSENTIHFEPSRRAAQLKEKRARAQAAGRARLQEEMRALGGVPPCPPVQAVGVPLPSDEIASGVKRDAITPPGYQHIQG